jgi:hypothetical protein
LLLVMGLVDSVTPLALGFRAAALPAAIIAGLAALGVMLGRGRHAFRRGRVALLLEERVPTLEYALVTALEGSEPGAAALERIVDRAMPTGVLRAPVARALGLSLALLVLPLLGVAASRPIPGSASSTQVGRPRCPATRRSARRPAASHRSRSGLRRRPTRRGRSSVWRIPLPLRDW